LTGIEYYLPVPYCREDTFPSMLVYAYACTAMHLAE